MTAISSTTGPNQTHQNSSDSLKVGVDEAAKIIADLKARVLNQVRLGKNVSLNEREIVYFSSLYPDVPVFNLYVVYCSLSKIIKILGSTLDARAEIAEIPILKGDIIPAQ
jgi:hypothetical protein